MEHSNSDIRELSLDEAQSVQGGVNLVGSVLGLVGLNANVCGEAGVSSPLASLGLSLCSGDDEEY